MNWLVLHSLAFTQRLLPLALAGHEKEREPGQGEQYERDPGKPEREAVEELAAEPVEPLHVVVHVVKHAAKHFNADHRWGRCVEVTTAQHSTRTIPYRLDKKIWPIWQYGTNGVAQNIDVKNINLQIKKHKNMFFTFIKKH